MQSLPPSKLTDVSERREAAKAEKVSKGTFCQLSRFWRRKWGFHAVLSKGTIVNEARAFAIEAHADQKRRYDEAPYIAHLDSVVSILKRSNVKETEIFAAAYLHDVVEDTDVTLQTIIESFGADIGQLVYWLTDCENGNRKTRALLSAWRLARAPWNAKVIKLADIIDNCASIRKHDPGFANIYLDEKRQVLRLMAEVENSNLLQFPLFLEAVSITDSTLRP